MSQQFATEAEIENTVATGPLADVITSQIFYHADSAPAPAPRTPLGSRLTALALRVRTMLDPIAPAHGTYPLEEVSICIYRDVVA